MEGISTHYVLRLSNYLCYYQSPCLVLSEFVSSGLRKVYSDVTHKFFFYSVAILFIIFTCIVLFFHSSEFGLLVEI